MAGWDDRAVGPMRPGHPGWPAAPPHDWPTGPPPGWPIGRPAAAPTPEPRSRRGVVGAVLALLVVAALAGAALVVTTGGDGDDEEDADRPPASSSTTAIDGPPPTDAPEPPPGDERAWTSFDGGEVTKLVADAETVYVLVDETIVEAYDAEDGTWLWELELFGAPLAFVPLSDRQLLVADDEGAEGTTILVDGATGEELWAVPGHPVPGYRSLGAGVTSPLATSDTVLLSTSGPDSEVLAVDRGTGETRWQVPGDDGSVCGEVVVTTTIDLVDFDEGTAETVGRSPADGSARWTSPGLAGACRDDEIGILGNGVAVVVGVADGATRALVPVDAALDLISSMLSLLSSPVIPLADHVVVMGSSDQMETSIIPRSGGPATWTGVVFPIPVPLTDAVLVVGEGLLVVRTDGTTSEPLPIDDTCEPWFTDEVVVGCAGTELITVALGTEPGETGRVDAGTRVTHVARAGERIVAAADDGSILAFG